MGDWLGALNLGTFGMIFGFFLARYFLIAGGAWWWFYRWGGARLAGSKIQLAMPQRTDLRREIGYSMLTALLFAATTAILVGPGMVGYSQLYREVAQHGWGWFWLSIALMFLLHDLYFYLTHRLMHQRWLFRHVHRVHHLSRNPTPFAAFSFHPLESVLEYGIFLIFLYAFPVHVGALLIWVVGMTLINVYGHLGWELYPRRAAHSRFWRWLNTAVSHNEHHERFHHNYGLYTLIWDRLFGTLSPDYVERFDAVSRRRLSKGDAANRAAI